MSKQRPNPCQSCGACCAYFRVSFFWREAEPEADPRVPIALTEELDSFQRCMQGTNRKRGAQCIALKGRIGENVGCSIYPNRPSPCRAFEYSYENGTPNKRCDQARAAHGLKPLPKPQSPKDRPELNHLDKDLAEVPSLKNILPTESPESSL